MERLSLAVTPMRPSQTILGDASVSEDSIQAKPPARISPASAAIYAALVIRVNEELGERVIKGVSKEVNTGAQPGQEVQLEPEGVSRLIHEAMEARKNSYAPYSHYAVGAAIFSQGGRIYRGCNVENASYGATICAERNALFSAVAAGERQFTALALVAGPDSVDGENLADKGLPYPSPCGICRQALREFVNPEEFQIICARSETDYKIYTLAELLPESFGPDYL
ncbi:cytidine deaminase [Lachnospiraceae bacterium NK3A20]|nr:cytidine deaminase [Lachnospiraceae bacterium NK3A20]